MFFSVTKVEFKGLQKDLVRNCFSIGIIETPSSWSKDQVLIVHRITVQIV